LRQISTRKTIVRYVYRQVLASPSHGSGGWLALRKTNVPTVFVGLAASKTPLFLKRTYDIAKLSSCDKRKSTS